MTRRAYPNLVFLLADQLRLFSCGYHGDTKAHTPAIDALARDGVNVVNAVSCMPVCSAFRASLFTGKHTTSTGMVINELRMNPNHRCLAHCLTDAGYDTSYIGKWHLWANELGNHVDPKNSFVPRGPYRLGFDGFWAAYNFRHHYFAPHAYYHTESTEKIPYPDGVFEPDAQTDMAIERIRHHARQKSPFALFVSYGTPHDPWVPENVPQQWFDRFRETAFTVPETYRDEPDMPYGDAWSNIAKSPEKIQAWMRVYYAMTANLDWNVGRIREALDESGLGADTVLVFCSDHGEMFGAHGRTKKNIFYEEATRIPFLVNWPGHIPAGRVTDACLSTVDIMPTLLGLCEIQPPDEVEGMDLSHCLKGRSGPEPDAALLQNTGACAAWEDGHEWRALRTKRYTYAIYRVDGSEMLFDNLNDPSQTRNLIADMACADTARNLRHLLAEKLDRIDDTFEAGTWYRDHWISDDRRILRSASMNRPPPDA